MKKGYGKERFYMCKKQTKVFKQWSYIFNKRLQRCVMTKKVQILIPVSTRKVTIRSKLQLIEKDIKDDKILKTIQECHF